MKRSVSLLLVFSLLTISFFFWACTSASDSTSNQEADADAGADLEPFLASYFASWSAGDMAGYREHFHQRAVIAAVTEGILTLSMSRDEFVQYQERAVLGKTLTERMTSFTANEDEVAATVTAEWVLDDGERTTTGVDRFTLIRDRLGNWRIVSLLYYTR
jgi:hypothetical protein